MYLSSGVVLDVILNLISKILLSGKEGKANKRGKDKRTEHN